MKNLTKIFLFYLIIIYLFSCKNQSVVYQQIKIHGEAQGTYYSIIYLDSLNRNFKSNIDSLLSDFDLTASIYNKKSIISRINNNDSNVKVNETFKKIFEISQRISHTTDGAFDISVGQLVELWGFGLKNRETITKEQILNIKNTIGYKKIKLIDSIIYKDNPNIKIDFNAIAQGYSVDMIGDFLLNQGIKNYLIDVGGEILASGAKLNEQDWVVGIERPSENMLSERELFTAIKLQNMAMATSGNYRKYYIENGVKYSHTIDPQTGSPVSHSLLSVSVIAKNCAQADAYATAFMVMGLEKAKLFLVKNESIDAFFIYSDTKNELKTYYTKNFDKMFVK